MVHRLDGKIYAVKKVKLRLGRFEEVKKRSKVFREVFAMTDLHHLNIVRYSTCWVEIEWDKSVQESSVKTKSFLEAMDLGDISENEDSDSGLDSGKEDVSKNSDMGFEWDVVSEKEKSSQTIKQKTEKVKKSLKKKLNEKTQGIPRKGSGLLIRTLSKVKHNT